MKTPTNPSLSPTALNRFLECKRCFWLQQHNIWKRPPTPFPSLLAGMDRICKEYFQQYVGSDQAPPELNALEGIRIFEDQKLLERWQNPWKGLHWTTLQGTLKGAVDTILRKNRQLIVLDCKTRGHPPTEHTANYYTLQLSVYTLLLQKNGYETPDYAYLLFYYPDRIASSQQVLFTTHLTTVKVDIAHAERVFKEALQCLREPEPTSGCPHCRR